MGFRPNVLKSRLNQTTSGFKRCSSRSMRNTLLGSSKDQQRTTENPSGSTCLAGSSSANTVRLRNGLRCSSCAMWNPYSLSPPVLGGKVVTRQIFIWLPLLSRPSFDVLYDEDVAVAVPIRSSRTLRGWGFLPAQRQPNLREEHPPRLPGFGTSQRRPFSPFRLPLELEGEE